jgi:hypothetical protein
MVPSIAIILSLVDMSIVDPARLTSKVMTWTWAHLFSILPNTYALFFSSVVRPDQRFNMPASRAVAATYLATGYRAIAQIRTQFAHTVQAATD